MKNELDFLLLLLLLFLFFPFTSPSKQQLEQEGFVV